MLKLLKYLKRSAGYIVCIMMLLFLQAYCDLSLPTYTSDIVNVGIQQKGIADCVPEELPASSMEHLKLFMEPEDQEKIDTYYHVQDDHYVLSDSISKEDRESLSGLFGRPILALSFFTQDSEQVQSLKEQMQLPPQADILETLEQLPPEAFDKILGEIQKQISQTPESIITQMAIAYLQQEYTAMGLDVDQIQIHYLLKIGLQMLGVAFLGMMAAVLVTDRKSVV